MEEMFDDISQISLYWQLLYSFFGDTTQVSSSCQISSTDCNLTYRKKTPKFFWPGTANWNSSMISVYFVRIYNPQSKTQSAFAMQCKYTKKQVEIGIFPQLRILPGWICWCAGSCRGLQARGLQKSMQDVWILEQEETDILGDLIEAGYPFWHFQISGCGSVGKLLWFKQYPMVPAPLLPLFLVRWHFSGLRWAGLEIWASWRLSAPFCRANFLLI